MKPFLRHQLERYAQRLEELDFLLSREDIMSDMAQYRVISKEHAEVTQVAGVFTAFLKKEADLRQAQHTSIIADIRIWTDAAGAKPAAQLRALRK